VLVTGAAGFVGTAARAAFAAVECVDVRAGTRAPERRHSADGFSWVRTPELRDRADWGAVLEGVDVVVHLAGRAHVLREVAADPEKEFRRVNVDGTRSLALAASQAGVRRVVFMSSIGVNGSTSGEGPFSEASAADPRTAYARSKWEAEQTLRAFGFDVVIVRPPLVYGPGAPGNFGRLVRWVVAGRPLPLGRVRNLRSFIGVTNLASFLVRAALAPEARDQLFLVSDGEDLSTAELIRRLASATRVRDPLVTMPVLPMRLAATVLRQRELFDQLFGSLVIDSSRARSLLAWTPPLTIDAELRRLIPEKTRA
jgi:nucleoside-diphosphate-sugar epimerase